MVVGYPFLAGNPPGMPAFGHCSLFFILFFPVSRRDDRPFHNHTQRYLRSAEKMARFHTKCRTMDLTDPQVRVLLRTNAVGFLSEQVLAVCTRLGGYLPLSVFAWYVNLGVPFRQYKM